MILFVFILGLIVGSFLNAVIHRLHTGESILISRSKCPHCRHVLGFSDLMPMVSFLLLRGKCRYCAQKISRQYPIVELTTAICFVLLVYNLQPTTYNLVFQAVFICVFIVIAVYDLKHYLILDKVVFPALAFSVAVNLHSSVRQSCFTDIKCPIYFGVTAGLIISGFFLMQYWFSRGRWIGFGDVKLGLLIGSVLGVYLGAFSLMLAYFLGALAGIGLIAWGKKQMSSKLPFGTFLGISAIITLLYGQSILDWYLHLIGF